jgi:hypothetical protein
MTNKNDNLRDPQGNVLVHRHHAVPESPADNALRYARSEGLPEEKIQEVLRAPYSTPCDLRRAADNYNDDD